MPKWKVESVPDVITGLTRHYVTDGERKFQIAQGTAIANQLSSLLNSLEEQNAEMQEERRWRKIGVLISPILDMPIDGQACQLWGIAGLSPYEWTWDEDYLHWTLSDRCGECRESISDGGYVSYLTQKYTHWRPAPTDVPKEEGNDA